MKFPVLVVSFLPVQGMAIFPFIFVKHLNDKQDKILINHERIHIQQQIELLIIPFYIVYLLNYMGNLMRYRNHQKAYLTIAFEQEAYQNEHDLYYLKRRKILGWLKLHLY